MLSNIYYAEKYNALRNDANFIFEKALKKIKKKLKKYLWQHKKGFYICTR
tara:strand:+ start:66746 stop:66895 length:150 start_codon:yes stop_codon:yes gene_type:complete